MEGPLGCFRVLLQHESWALGVPERDNDKSQADGDLDDVGDSPGNVVRGLMEGHPVASPKRDETAQLVAELGDGTDKTTT